MTEIEESDYDRMMRLGKEVHALGGYLQNSHISLDLHFEFSGTKVYKWKALETYNGENKTFEQEMHSLFRERLPNSLNNSPNVTNCDSAFNDTWNQRITWLNSAVNEHATSISNVQVKVSEDSHICPGLTLMDNRIIDANNLRNFIQSVTLAIGGYEDEKIKEAYKKLSSFNI